MSGDPPAVAAIAQDLADEQDALDAIVAPLDDDGWRTPTPSPRWDVADQIAHLTFFDLSAVHAIGDPAAFADDVTMVVTAMAHGAETLDDVTLQDCRTMEPAVVLERWREGRRLLGAAAATLADDARVPWYGPSMGAKSFLSARLMETWAHGQDVVDALGADRPPTGRLRHVVTFSYLTRGWSYANRGLTAPTDPLRLDLAGPDGDAWRLGPDDAPEVVSGPAEDFCLVAVQRRHLDDTALVVTPHAREWLLIAQAFAGPPTDGPAPGARP